MLRAVIFDFNGVLVDDEPLHFELLRRIFEEEGLQLEDDDYFRRYVGVDDRGCIRDFFSRAGREVDESLLARLVARKASYYQQRIAAEGYRFFPGALALIESAVQAGLSLAVVSGALRQELEGALQQAGIRDRFKSVVSAEDVRRGKPEPEGYRLAVEELNSRAPLPERLFHPHEILAIEDTVAGLEAAAGAGLVTLGVSHTLPLDTLARADFHVASLDGVTAAWLQERYLEASRS